ncbi:hypothetical protein UNDYM_6007 (plasmid) [Undibacterium sp. YM2]|uniref:hypothetical protein n=1 Tax=Undibacterium sp. YM2 TaxID=2058625 RepID=UPI001331F983|nr:hypothetical protein [Undibacterium sp. YM2]BBB70260.1 hypothetical protein UNDYM_6007 [Undibacterium sp. YM2]
MKNELNNFSNAQVMAVPEIADQKKNILCPWVSEDVEIVTKKSLYGQSIWSIKIGDEILARCDKTGQMAFRKVLNIFTEKDVPTYLLYYVINNQVPVYPVEVTASLPFWVKNKGWTPVFNIKKGDALLGFDRFAFSEAEKNGIEHFSCEEWSFVDIKKTGLLRRVYSLELEEMHSYFVGGIKLCAPDATYLATNSHAITNEKMERIITGGVICGVQTDTMVEVKEHGPLAIEWLLPEAGHEILSRCDKTGQLGYSKVRKLICHEETPQCELTFQINDDEYRVVRVAEGQEFLMEGNIWVRAVDLKPRDVFETNDNNRVVVDEIQTKFIDDEPRYNSFYTIELEGYNSFCIDNRLWVRGIRFDEE